MPPTRPETITVFDAVLSGLTTRAAASSWAAPWIGDREREVDDLALFEALTHLVGADLRHGGGDPYLFTEAQISQWKVELLAAP